MPADRKKPRNEVSFTTFRRLQLMAIQEIWVKFCNQEDVPVDDKLSAWAMQHALREARYADAVFLAAALASQMYGNVTSYRLSAQLVNLVKKVPFKGNALDPEGAALGKFLQAESDCRGTNEALRPFRALMCGTSTDRIRLADDAQRIFSIFTRAQKHIRRVIGNKPPLPEIYAKCRFGSGACVGIHGDSTHLLRKMSSETWTCTRTAMPYVLAAAKLSPSFWDALGLHHTSKGLPQLYKLQPSFLHSVNVIRASVDERRASQGAIGINDLHAVSECTVPKAPRLSSLNWVEYSDHLSLAFDQRFAKRVQYVEHDLIKFVLKQADCHRTVGNQPLLNTFVQLGTGDWMRDRLKSVDIDLRYGQEKVNGPLAYLGSSCEGLPFATIDLKQASDTLSIEACKLLLPPAWFHFLNSIRTPAYRLPDGTEDRYEKFVAMGNGFCFPLETLIFWSLVQAVYDLNVLPDRTCAVYGDDIIVYQSAALELIEALSVAGFETNVAKTFVFGPFRESCGQDFFDGVNVRPFVLDEIFENWGQVYHYVNSLAQKGFRALSERLVEQIPVNKRLYRPRSGTSNTAIDAPLDVCMTSPHVLWDKELQCWSWLERCTVPVADPDEYDVRNHLRVALNGGSASETGTVVCTKRRKTETFVRRVAHG